MKASNKKGTTPKKSRNSNSAKPPRKSNGEKLVAIVNPVVDNREPFWFVYNTEQRELLTQVTKLIREYISVQFGDYEDSTPIAALYNFYRQSRFSDNVYDYSLVCIELLKYLEMPEKLSESQKEDIRTMITDLHDMCQQMKLEVFYLELMLEDMRCFFETYTIDKLIELKEEFEERLRSARTGKLKNRF